jgi:hypothetical protein
VAEAISGADPEEALSGAWMKEFLNFDNLIEQHAIRERKGTGIIIIILIFRGVQRFSGRQSAK